MLLLIPLEVVSIKPGRSNDKDTGRPPHTHLYSDEVQHGGQRALAPALAQWCQQLHGLAVPELDMDQDGDALVVQAGVRKVQLLLGGVLEAQGHLPRAGDVTEVGREVVVDGAHDAHQLGCPARLHNRVSGPGQEGTGKFGMRQRRLVVLAAISADHAGISNAKQKHDNEAGC